MVHGLGLMDLAVHSEALLGVSLLSILTWPRLTALSWKSPLYKWLVVFALCSSWLFASVSSLLLSVTPSDPVCLGAVFMCACFYGVSKFCIYLFLIERLHLIATSRPRHQNPVYVVSTLLLVPFIAVMAVIMVFHVNVTGPEGCHIGVTREAAILLGVYDTVFGISQIGLFSCIMCRYITRAAPNDAQSTILRKALKVAFTGSIGASVLSFFNILTLAIKEDLQANICFLLCILDVIGNACIITYLVRPIPASTSTSTKSRTEQDRVRQLTGL